jgi:competence protein ComEA
MLNPNPTLTRTLVALALALAAPSVRAAEAGRTAPQPRSPVVELAQASAEGAPEGVVNVNEATLEQLQLLPGVGPTRAQAIIAHRERHPFRRPEELVSVRGIGRSTLNRLLPYVTVEGRTTLTRAVSGGRTRAPRNPQ